MRCPWCERGLWTAKSGEVLHVGRDLTVAACELSKLRELRDQVVASDAWMILDYGASTAHEKSVRGYEALVSLAQSLQSKGRS